MAKVVNDLQKSLYESLSNINYDVYDNVPSDASFPYVRIDSEIIDNNPTKTDDTTDHTFILNIFSEYDGYKELREIIDEINEQLELGLTLENDFVCNYIEISRIDLKIDSTHDLRQGTLLVIVKVSK